VVTELLTLAIAAMENESLPSDVWNDVTTSSSEDDNLTQYLANIRDLALKVIYIIIGTVGVLDNVFVIIVFALFIKITDKVPKISGLSLFVYYAIIQHKTRIYSKKHTNKYKNAKASNSQVLLLKF